MNKSKRGERAPTVAAINWKGEWGNKAANLRKMESRIREASQLGADFICFPELSLSGYECGEEIRRTHRPCSMHMETAETIPGPSTEALAGLARDLDVYVVFGMPERDVDHPSILYPSVAVVGPDGILGRYRKLHLGGPPVWTETYCFRTGDDLPLFQTRYGPIGVLSCADVWCFPELSRLLTLKGARIIFNATGSASIPGNETVMTHVTAARAMENIVYIVSANHVGRERTVSYYGHSTIAGIQLPECCRILAQGGQEEEIVWASLNFEILEYARKICTLNRGRWELIADEYRRLVESKTEDSSNRPVGEREATDS